MSVLKNCPNASRSAREIASGKSGTQPRARRRFDFASLGTDVSRTFQGSLWFVGIFVGKLSDGFRYAFLFSGIRDIRRCKFDLSSQKSRAILTMLAVEGACLGKGDIQRDIQLSRNVA